MESQRQRATQGEKNGERPSSRVPTRQSHRDERQSGLPPEKVPDICSLCLLAGFQSWALSPKAVQLLTAPGPGLCQPPSLEEEAIRELLDGTHRSPEQGECLGLFLSPCPGPSPWWPCPGSPPCLPCPPTQRHPSRPEPLSAVASLPSSLDTGCQSSCPSAPAFILVTAIPRPTGPAAPLVLPPPPAPGPPPGLAAAPPSQAQRPHPGYEPQLQCPFPLTLLTCPSRSFLRASTHMADLSSRLNPGPPHPLAPLV